MELKWMGKYRSLVEKFILYANTYTTMYNKQSNYGTTIKISASQIQTLEYIMENENLKMSEIAQKLGITRSAFSKNVSKLEEKGLIDKFKKDNNNKDIFLFASEFGKKTYEEYSKFIYKFWFKEMFEIADQIPREYLDIFEDMMEKFAESFRGRKSRDAAPVYIPLSKFN